MKSDIINHIKEYRNNNGWTQEELAAKAGVSRQSIVSIEKGKYIPSLPLALKFSELFGCSTDVLFQRKEVNKHG
ncbi:helix-turn-helix transcriptional regulator [candidate division KSB1 bacterium]|nr:helix-turn-helix transcriptional regulator [candidate division KSB1 bacterium]